MKNKELEKSFGIIELNTLFLKKNKNKKFMLTKEQVKDLLDENRKLGEKIRADRQYENQRLLMRGR